MGHTTVLLTPKAKKNARNWFEAAGYVLGGVLALIGAVSLTVATKGVFLAGLFILFVLGWITYAVKIGLDARDMKKQRRRTGW